MSSSSASHGLLQTAVLIHQRGELAQAESMYRAVLEGDPGNSDALHLIGVIEHQRHRHLQALELIDKAIEISPRNPYCHVNRGLALLALKRSEEAVKSFDEAIRLKPDHAEAFHGRGDALRERGRFEEALVSYDEAIRLKNGHAEVLHNRGSALLQLGRPAEALASYEAALRLKPGHAFWPGVVASIRARICQWNGLDEQVAHIVDGILRGEPLSLPFPLLALVDDPRVHLLVARRWVREEALNSGSSGPIVGRRRGRRIHIAYLSADYHDHATSHLAAGLFESHDRERFEITALSFGPDQGDATRQRVRGAFDRFEDVRASSDVQIARRCRELGVDIAVDLKGYTQDSRPGIFAERCAPVQIQWLGYPGTMAASFIDYIVADRTLIGEADLVHYTEKVIWLPDSYQVNDRRRPIADQVFTREACGLPGTGFVFCCFNNNYKILPQTFDVWMRLLRRVPGSVLWLLEDNETAGRHLRAEAAARGVDPTRLVFARRMPLAEHLARHCLADLFVDTWPYNAHTTASDALWAGLPVLTRSGRSFASRVAASLLRAVGLPELITHSDEEYEELAVALAGQPARLRALKEKLWAQRLTHPLFDCERFTRHLESAYVQAMERHWAGAAPESFLVEAVDQRAGRHACETPRTHSG